MGTPLPRGLYDPNFGPTETGGTPCITCGCLYGNCPGHAGHLELCVPVYHPLLFGNLMKFLRSKCFACHKFREGARQLEIFQTKFSLLKQGRDREALELEETLAQAVKRAKDSVGLKSNASHVAMAVETAMDQVLAEKQQKFPGQVHEETSFERSIKHDLVKQFISSNLGCKKCNHCGAFSPKIRQDSSNKIFQAPLPASSKRLNRAENITLKSALEKLSIDNEGYDSDVTAEQDLDLDEDGGDEEEQQQETKQTDKYMHALEVEAQVKWTWQLHPQLCENVFGDKCTFFLRAVPIPPARFRPPMVLGTMTVEHAQNAYLNKMLTQNDRIRSLLAEQEDPKSQAMALTTWIDLQTTVNCYMDSSKDPSAASMNQQSGIRQILEKKEGIFRK